MIRFINCVRRRADISSEEFRQYWNDPKLDAIISQVVEYTGAVGYAKNLTLIVAANDLMRERCAYGEPFDGALEYSWENASQLHNVLTFQRQFVDLEKSCAFFLRKLKSE